jgi:hypothetical protein
VLGEILKKGAGLLLLLLLISACGEIGGSGQCGGGDETGACIQIESIVPKDDDKNTSSVDVLPSFCVDGMASSTAGTSTSKAEPFSSHDAELTVSNKPLPGVLPANIGDVTLRKFSIRYTLNRCLGSGTICPLPTPLPPDGGTLPMNTIVILANGSSKFTLPFFPLDSKDEYVSASSFNSLFAFPHYTATYRLTGTDQFNRSVSVEGSQEFEIGAYNNCDG